MELTLPLTATLPTVESWSADTRILVSSIKALGRQLRILEAGCGREWPLKLDGVDYHLTGIDLDGEALQARLERKGDLDEAIVGDLCAPGMIPPGSFDVIYSSFVLEHLADAEGALVSMINGLKSGGLLLLRIPDRYSVYGWTSRSTPFWLHVAYYRLILGRPNAGKPGFAPYPTHHREVVSRAGIRAFCERHGCVVAHEHAHTYYLHEGRFKLLMRIYARALSALSFGHLSWRHNNLTYVIRKR